MREFRPKIILITLCVFILLSVCKNFAQYDSIKNGYHIDHLSPEGILFDKGWKFQAGDNPDYAKLYYDDSKWQDINPTLDVHDLPQIKEGTVWFRLHLF
jgi:hypothetical protein